KTLLMAGNCYGLVGATDNDLSSGVGRAGCAHTGKAFKGASDVDCGTGRRTTEVVSGFVDFNQSAQSVRACEALVAGFILSLSTIAGCRLERRNIIIYILNTAILFRQLGRPA